MIDPSALPGLATFSQPARNVLTFAREEAERVTHNHIGTEHLLLGLVREGEGVAAQVLAGLHVDIDLARRAVESTVGRGDRRPIGEIALTPRARKVLELAAAEAGLLDHHSIGTEHLLLGLVREGEGLAADVLESLGSDMKRIRRETLRALSGPSTPRRRLVEPGQAKDNVVTCRIAVRDLAAIDALVEAGIRSTRSAAAAWLLHAGIQADHFTRVAATADTDPSSSSDSPASDRSAVEPAARGRGAEI